MPDLTPSQTIGPFFHDALRWAVAEVPAGVRVAGRVLDRDGKGINDALLEIWQPQWSAAPLQRVYTDDNGAFAFAMPPPSGAASCANVTVFARGLLRELFTRVYLHPTDDASGLPLPEGVPTERRATLLARRHADGSCRWDVRLQGPGETVFFAI